MMTKKRCCPSLSLLRPALAIPVALAMVATPQAPATRYTKSLLPRSCYAARRRGQREATCQPGASALKIAVQRGPQLVSSHAGHDDARRTHLAEGELAASSKAAHE